MKATLARAGAGKVMCRLCKGDHFTAKCPYKDSLAGLETVGTYRFASAFCMLCLLIIPQLRTQEA
jgi:hypothetical protein